MGETQKTVTEEEIKEIIKEHAYKLWKDTVNQAHEFIQSAYDYAYSNYEWDGDDVGFTLDEMKEWTKELEEKMKADLKPLPRGTTEQDYEDLKTLAEDKPKPTLEELCEKCTPENRHEEIFNDGPVGKELL